MSYSFQTNVTSLVAQQNLETNATFQSQTITQLTSGYRINSSGDDAACGLFPSPTSSALRSPNLPRAYREREIEGVNVLQTIDGGLNNISQDFGPIANARDAVGVLRRSPAIAAAH